jgi:hypothetical protein
MNYNEWNFSMQKCEACGWENLGKEAVVRESFRDGVEFECPNCKNYLGFFDFPMSNPLFNGGTVNKSNKDANVLIQNSNEDHPRLIKLKQDVYSLPVDSEYKRALLESISLFGDDILKSPENSPNQGFDDLENIQQITLARRMEDLLENAVGSIHSEPTDCPFCQKNECEHLIADLAVTEGHIRSGLILNYLSYNQEMEVYELKEKLEVIDGVDFYDYEVDESSGNWEYVKFWSRTPKAVLDSLFKIKNNIDNKNSIPSTENTLISFGTDYDFYIGHKCWNELSLEQRTTIIEHEFGEKKVDIQDYVMSTNLKKMQFNGLRAIYVASLMLNERMELIKPNVNGLLDKKYILDILENTKLWIEITDLLNNNADEVTEYDGIELEHLAFTNNIPSVLDETIEMPISTAIDFIRNSLEASLKKEKTLSGNQDKSRFNQSNKLASDNLSDTNTPFSFFDYFRCSEVKWIRKEIHYFFKRNSFMLKDDVLMSCLKESNNSDKAKYSINVDHIKPTQIALTIIRNYALKKLAYGDLYIYRGLYNTVGKEYKKLFIAAVREMEKFGFIDKAEADRDIAEIIELIKNSG